MASIALKTLHKLLNAPTDPTSTARIRTLYEQYSDDSIGQDACYTHLGQMLSDCGTELVDDDLPLPGAEVRRSVLSLVPEVGGQPY